MESLDQETDEQVQVNLRISRNKLDKFRDILGWRGAFPQFVEECLDAFIMSWGDHPTPREMIHDAARSVIKHRV